MAEYVRWDIVKVPFPFTEGLGDKRRPALIVSTPQLTREHGLYWLLMITSVTKPVWTGDVAIKNFIAAGLPVPSVIRTAKITTLQGDRILGRIGHLAQDETRRVTTAMKGWF
jgi:mRNA interferase MazF